MKQYFNVGPGFIVSAAFIGPGTIITCLVSGIKTQYSLIWALLFSILVVIALQEMVVRITLHRGLTIAEILHRFENRVMRAILICLTLIAIVIGNSAYQAGNIIGAKIGVSYFIKNDFVLAITSLIIFIIIFFMLYFGKYKILEKGLVLLVFIMGISFMSCLFFLPVDFGKLLKGLNPINSSENSLYEILALIGTTIVPYNIFLHSAVIKKKWDSFQYYETAKKELIIAVLFGGLISSSILITAASLFQGYEISTLSEMIEVVEIQVGSFMGFIIAIGIFAAGLTSSITAPLAAAYTLCGLFGLKSNNQSLAFRFTWMFVLAIGVLISLLDLRPLGIIQMAQFVNALLLPIICLILLIAMNSKVLGKAKNGVKSNIIALFVFVVILFLSYKVLIKLI